MKGVPLFSGAKYVGLGSKMARVIGIFDMRFEHLLPCSMTAILGAAIHVNFLAHHFLPDIRGYRYCSNAAAVWPHPPLVSQP